MKNPVRGLRALGGRTLRGLLSPGSAHVAAGLPNPPTPSRRVGRFQRNVSLDMVFRVYGGAGAGNSGELKHARRGVDFAVQDRVSSHLGLPARARGLAALSGRLRALK